MIWERGGRFSTAESITNVQRSTFMATRPLFASDICLACARQSKRDDLGEYQIVRDENALDISMKVNRHDHNVHNFLSNMARDVDGEEEQRQTGGVGQVNLRALAYSEAM